MATITVVDNQDMLPLPLAHVWNESAMVGAVTNLDGIATIEDDADMIGTWRVSFIGYQTANVVVTEPSSILVKLVRGVNLPEIEITPDNDGTASGGDGQPPPKNYAWLLLAGFAALLLLNRK
jgi:MYXO-CTERM domain-containing protein